MMACTTSGAQDSSVEEEFGSGDDGLCVAVGEEGENTSTRVSVVQVDHASTDGRECSGQGGYKAERSSDRGYVGAGNQGGLEERGGNESE